MTAANPTYANNLCSPPDSANIVFSRPRSEMDDQSQDPDPYPDAPYCPECGCRCNACKPGLTWPEATFFIAMGLVVVAIAAFAFGVV